MSLETICYIKKGEMPMEEKRESLIDLSVKQLTDDNSACSSNDWRSAASLGKVELKTQAFETEQRLLESVTNQHH